MTAIPQRPGRRTHILKHSTWITATWNWFLELAGRAAEAILVLSVLYASVKLLPVVRMPAWLDVIVFVAQFVALDVGGLSLSKLAKQAQAEGNEDGAKLAGRMSKALITIMIAGVVVVAIEQLFSIPGDWKLGIDTVLLIARSILAVLYGHTIHSLRHDDLFDLHVTTAPDLQEHLSQAIANLQTKIEQRLATIAGEIDQVRQSVPVLEYEARFEAVARNLEANFEARLEAAMRQKTVVSEARQIEAAKAERKPREAKPEATGHGHDASNIVTLRQPGAGTTDKRSLVYSLLAAGDQRSSYQLAPLIGCSAATIQRYMRDWKTARAEASREATESAI